MYSLISHSFLCVPGHNQQTVNTLDGISLWRSKLWKKIRVRQLGTITKPQVMATKIPRQSFGEGELDQKIKLVRCIHGSRSIGGSRTYFLGLNTPCFFSTSHTMGTVEFTGFEITRTKAPGQFLATPSAKSRMIPALI